LTVDAILLADGAERKEQLAAWAADEKQVSAYAMNLQQIDNGIVIPPSGWKCAKCDKKDNLWLNLTDGMILCGRKNWDGSGGNNHAIEHYEKTRHPLAVKLGTITADLEAAGDAPLLYIVLLLYVSINVNGLFGIRFVIMTFS
jgi:ubiquitin carboxyl-terminal hydrolase 5/13